MVQYGCSPLKPRGNQPFGASAAIALIRSLGCAANDSGFTSRPARANEAPGPSPTVRRM